MQMLSSRTISLFSFLCLLLFVLFFSRVSDAATPLGGGQIDLRYPSTTTVSATGGDFASLLQRSSEVAASGFYDLMHRSAQYTATALRLITPAKIASISRPIAKRLGPAGLAYTLIELVWNEAEDIWEKPGDLEVPIGPQGCWRGYQGLGCFDTPTAGCEDVVSHYPMSTPNHFHSAVPYNGMTTMYSCIQAYCPLVNCSTGEVTTSRGYSTVYNICPTGKIIKNGLCVDPQLLPNTPATDEEIEAEILRRMLESPIFNKPKEQVQRLIDLEGLENILPHFDPVSEITGPEEFKPHTETTTKTTAEGVETTTVKNEYPITYLNPKTINVVNKRTTTVVKPNGDTIITVEIFTADSSSSGGGPNSPWPAFCDWAKYVCDFIDWVKLPPEIPTDDPELPTETIAPKDWSSGLSSGSCPSPIHIELIQGKSMEFTFTDACYVASNVIHPILLMMAYLSAAVILVGMRRAD